jgi:flavin-dependent dehydrogenase
MVNGRVVLVGDAAAQVKPLSGGGIVTGLLCARQCARTITEALGASTFSVRDLQRYQSRWRRVVGRELSWGMAFRRYYRSMGDQVLEKWFRELQRPRVRAAIDRHGDIDFPSRLVLPVLAAAPGLAVRLPGVLRSYRRREEGGGGGT